MAGKPTITSMRPEEEHEAAWLIATGHTPEAAAEAIGFPDASRLYHAMRTKRFSELLDRAVKDSLRRNAPEALETLRCLLRDPATPARVRADVAKTLLDRAGHPAVASSKADDHLVEKRPEEMTSQELAGLIERLEREKSGRAIPVNERPATESPPSNFLD